MTPSFEARLRQLEEEACAILPRLSLADVQAARAHHVFLAQASEDELRRRGNPQ